MLMCPQCGSVRIAIRGAGGSVYSVNCQECRYGWETGRWKPRYTEDEEEMPGGRRRNGTMAPITCQLDERVEL